MNQPTDRLGQPLSVGDWVEYKISSVPLSRFNGLRNRIVGFGLVFGCPVADLDDGMNALLGSLTKINPKPETTTWDKCVFVPESVQTAN